MTARTTAHAVTAVVTSVALVGGVLLVSAGPAEARKKQKKPTKPTAVTALASTPTSLTVRATVRYGKKFRVYAATTPARSTRPATGRRRTPARAVPRP